MAFPALAPATVADLVLRAADQTPKDEDVTAGGWGALIFVLLILAVVVLGFSLVKQLRKAQAAEDAGVYGSDEDSGSKTSEPSEPSEPENHSSS